MAGPLLILLLLGQSLEVPLGEPFLLDYDVPIEMEPLPLEPGEGYSILEQRGDSVLIVPLMLDTLELPGMRALYGGREMLFQPPLVIVGRTVPDTTWTVPVFTSPIDMRIPAGFPIDYLRRHVFWEKWGRAPSRTWIILLAAAVALLLAVTSIWLLRRRGKERGEDIPAERPPRLSPADEALALLDSKAFAEGNWTAYYREVEKLLRNTVAFRFGVTNRALTWMQISRQLSGDREGRRFNEASGELVREVVLQRYASWGGSRDRARRFTQVLSDLRKEWHIR